MKTDSENWNLLQTLFHLAEETPAEDRERVLAEHCSNPELVRRALDIFDSSAALDDGAPVPEPAVPLVRVGPYALVRLLGTGGIGSVYLAERIVGGAPQRVALKMLAPHAAGASFIERFRREQHILGSLDHPNITRLIDAGISEAGQQYLVMELVDGEHLDAYCDHRKLGIEERLRLFLDVCEAVAYAHRNLIVHLDLKPPNILVSQDGAVKLLDFGTSKLIRTDSLFTTTVMATPAYASPEQLRNEPVTTACDVYALGAVLFELLSGRRPYANSSVAAMIERAITEQRPENLLNAITVEGAQNRGVSDARLGQSLKGDLQTIVEKCLLPRPSERYTSVDSLAQDIRRYLDGEPVMARRQTLVYRLGKFARRHRIGVIAGATVAVLLIGSVSYAGWRQQQALEEGRRAERMQTFMYSLFRLANSNYTGKPATTLPEFLELGAQVLPQYIHDSADLRAAQMSLAESMSENRDWANAKKVFTQTDASAKAAGDIDAEAESEVFLGHIAYQQGQMKAGAALTAHALQLSRNAKVSPTVRVWCKDIYAFNRDSNGFASDETLRLLREAAKEAQEKSLPTHEAGAVDTDLAEDLVTRGLIDEAEPIFRQVLQLYGDDPSELCSRSLVDEELGNIEANRGNLQTSIAYNRKAYDEAVRCGGPNSYNALAAELYLADNLVDMGHQQAGRDLLQKDMPAWRKIYKGPNLIFPMYYWIKADIATADYSGAEAIAREGIALMTAGNTSPTLRAIGIFQFLWAKALVGEHRDQEALPHAEIADRRLHTSGAIGKSPRARKIDAEERQLLVSLYARLGKDEEARKLN